jgi:hypothetical protein
MRTTPVSRGAGATSVANGSAPPSNRPVPAQGRWESRPALATGLRVGLFALPLGASLVAAWIMARVLADPDGLTEHLLWWSGVLAASLGAMLVFDRAVRRVLPLAGLLQLSLIFPDRAPSRLGVALRSGSTRRLQDREVEALARGDLEPAQAAHTILALAASLNTHDRNTRGHSERVRAYADLIGAELGLDESERDRLRWAALLHDLGKLSVPPSTLNNHHALTTDDWETLRRHPLEGARLAQSLRDWLGPWSLAIEQHHERYDGTGYPYGLAGHEISLGARIVAVADSYDAMTSARAYSTGMSAAAARRELAAMAGTHFDPVVVRAFLSVAIGRVRWAMGPFAFLAAIPFAPAFGGVRRSIEAAGRTAAMGAASVAATAAVLQPVATPVRVIPVREEPRPAAVAPAIEVAAPPAVEEPAPPPPEPVPEPPPQVVAAAVTPPQPVARPAAAPVVAAPVVPAVPVVPVVAPPPLPDPVPVPLPVLALPPLEPPVLVECRVNGRADSSGRPCLPPRWGHTEQGNPEPH